MTVVLCTLGLALGGVGLGSRSGPGVVTKLDVTQVRT